MQNKQQEHSSLIDLLERIDSRIGLIEAQVNELRAEQNTEWAKFKHTGLTKKSRRIWSEQEIAAYLQLGVRHVRRSIITQEDFPKPISHSIDGKGKKKPRRRYFVGDVIAYFEAKERYKQTQTMILAQCKESIDEIATRARRKAMLAMRGI